MRITGSTAIQLWRVVAKRFQDFADDWGENSGLILGAKRTIEHLGVRHGDTLAEQDNPNIEPITLSDFRQLNAKDRKASFYRLEDVDKMSLEPEEAKQLNVEHIRALLELYFVEYGERKAISGKKKEDLVDMVQEMKSLVNDDEAAERNFSHPRMRLSHTKQVYTSLVKTSFLPKLTKNQHLREVSDESVIVCLPFFFVPDPNRPLYFPGTRE